MAIQSVLPVGEAAIQAYASHVQEPVWLTQWRLDALKLAETLPLPVLEKMNLERWELGAYGSYKQQQQVERFDQLPAEVRAFLRRDRQTNTLVQLNSGVVYSSLAPEWTDQGVVFCNLETAAKQYPDLVKKHLLSVVKAGENRLTALHAAVWSGGVFLYVPRNVVIDEPLQAIFVANDDTALYSPHILIVAEANSSVTYVDNAFSVIGGGRLVHNCVVEVVAEAGAEVRFASIHHFDRGTTDLTCRRARLGQDAKIWWTLGELSFGDSASDTSSLLEGRGSESDAKVICIGTGEQKMNVTTRAVHIGKNSVSDMVTRAVMRDKATAIVNGITKIEKGATDANGVQTERILMLSPEARGDANPLLLIDEDEVQAGHAASVGQVNPEQIYYMMSRGIRREDAERLLIYGFLAPNVAAIPIKEVEEQLAQMITRKLER